MIHIRDGFPEQRQVIMDNDKLKYWEESPFTRSLVVSHIGSFPKTNFHFVERLDGIPQHLIILNLTGKGWLRIGDKLWKIHPNDVAFIPANTPHAYGADDSLPWNIYWLHMKGLQADEFMQLKEGIISDNIFSLSSTERVVESFETALRYSIADFNDATVVNLVSTTHQLLADLISFRKKQKGRSQNVEKRIIKSIRYMQQSIDKNLTLEELATFATLSIPHYLTLFKSHTGSSPLRFFTRLRLQKACELLEETDQTIQSIAFHLGYEDPFYFGRVFKKFLEISPNKYRKRIRESTLNQK